MGIEPVKLDHLFANEGEKPIKIAPNGELFSEGEEPTDVVVSTLANDLGGEF